MKRIPIAFLTLFLSVFMTLTMHAQNLPNTHAAAPQATPFPRQLPPARPGKPPRTEGEPIHMPDLLGRTLEYATNIWDEDEPLPQITVKRLSNDNNVVIVQQSPAPGTMIVPEHTRIQLTLDHGPAPRPAPVPSTTARPHAATASQATLLRSPYVQNLTTSSVVIVWTTVEDGLSEVHYGQNDYAQIATATSTLFTTPAPAPYDSYYVHEATLSGLSADTAYQYQIFTNGIDLTPGGSVTTRTAKSSTTNHFRLAVFGDSGDGSQDQINVATRLQQVNPDIAVHVGDIIYNEATYDGFETKYFQIYKDLIKRVWIAPAMGNHDVTYNNGKSFTDVFVNPPNATNPAERELYYSFDYGNAHFTVLNNYFSMTTVGSAQYNWLQNDLASTNQFWKFVVFHVPAYATNSLQQPKDNAGTVQNLVPLFEQYHVNVVVNGHYHYYERMYPLLGGQVSTIDAGGIVYLVTGGGGAGLDSIGTGTRNIRTAAKVQDFELSLFDINGCSLQLQGVRKASGPSDAFDSSDVFDSYTIDRCGTPSSTNTPTNTAVAATNMPTNTPTNTPAAATNTPTNTAAAATNTPTAGGSVLFSDDFESGSMAQWSKVNGVGVQQQEVYSGSYAARATS
ncbi:MAG TPA: metallophosphoesterase, partial [Roseiflexaceae bacterium]|nr:metallophosphoesterase [Roseiflexaceae bacterium]